MGGSNLDSIFRFIFDKIHPIGSYYLSDDPTNPSKLFGGTWEAVKDRFVVGAGGSYSVKSTGGEATHKLTASEIPSHTHPFSATTSSGGSHSHEMWDGILAYGIDGSKKSKAITWKTGGGPYDTIQGLLQNQSKDVRRTYNDGTHSHSVSGTTGAIGSSQAHNNMPPYIATYIWKRIA